MILITTRQRSRDSGRASQVIATVLAIGTQVQQSEDGHGAGSKPRLRTTSSLQLMDFP